MISGYCGTAKPPNLCNYLAPLMEDVQRLNAMGMMLKRIHVDVIPTATVCATLMQKLHRGCNWYAGTLMPVDTEARKGT